MAGPSYILIHVFGNVRDELDRSDRGKKTYSGWLREFVTDTPQRLTEIAFRLIFGIETRCAWCRRIASAGGRWQEREAHDEHQVSDGLCPACDEQMVAILDRRAVEIA